jgi:hypothetical protein
VFEDLELLDWQPQVAYGASRLSVLGLLYAVQSERYNKYPVA